MASAACPETFAAAAAWINRRGCARDAIGASAFRNASYARSCTSARRGAMQVCPPLVVAAHHRVRAANAGSASPRTRAESRPDSSSVLPISRAPSSPAMARPTSVEPVNTRWSIGPCSPRTSAAPASRSDPMTSSQPAGHPASTARPASRRCVRGLFSEGLSTTRLPATNACTRCCPASRMG